MKPLAYGLSVIGLVALGTGCHEAQPEVSDGLVVQKAAAPVQPADRSVSPPNAYRRGLTREAMRGLLYDTGRVVIDVEAAGKIVAGEDAQQARVAFESGQELLGRNAIIEAVKAHTKAVLLDPDEAEYYEGLGTALLVKRKMREAEAAFRTALDLAPGSVSARFNLADALNRQGRLDEGMGELRRVLALDPGHAEAHGRLAIGLYYAGRGDEAWEHVQQAEALGHAVPPQFRALLAGEDIRAEVRQGLRAGTLKIGPQTRVDLGNAGPGNETSIASFNYDPMETVATWNDYRLGSARMGVSLSQDGGQTWNDFLVRPPVAYQAATEGDPMTAFDNRTGALWVGAISFASNGGVFVARKNAGESTFQPVVMAEVTGSADKCWMAAGRDHTGPDSTRVYIAYNQGLLISTDMGDTWNGPTYLDTGLGFLPRIGPNGELYIVYWDWSGASNRIELIRSYDGGSTLSGGLLVATRMDVWGVEGSRFPGRFRAAPLAHLGIDPNKGTLYCVYFDTTNMVGGNSNVDLYFTKSTNQGTSWTTPVIINTDGLTPGDQFFPWIEVDPTGRLHLLFFDTRSVVQDDDPTDTDPHAYIEAYYSYSDNGGSSWTEIVLTDSAFDAADDGFGGQFIGDYLGIGIGGRRTYPAYLTTDRGTADVFVHAIVDVVPGDINEDGAVDLGDYTDFDGCLTGPGGGIPPDCEGADLDGDLDVDVDDFAEFAIRFLE